MVAAGSGTDGEPPRRGHRQPIEVGPVERVCDWLCQAALVVMIVLIGSEVFTRALFNFSFQISDEVGGYMLVAIAFLSLSVCQSHHTFHRVEFIQAKLSERGRAVSDLIFDLAALALSSVLLWQLVRLELSSWHSGDEAPTYLMTPLWLPRLAMVVGIAALVQSVVRTIVADLRRIGTSGQRR